MTAAPHHAHRAHRCDGAASPNDTTATQRACRHFALRLAEAETRFRIDDGPADAVARSAVRLAAVLRILGQCERAESVLNNVLSTFTWVALSSESASLSERLESVEAARWCADELAELYEEHAMMAEAEMVRGAWQAIHRRACEGEQMS